MILGTMRQSRKAAATVAAFLPLCGYFVAYPLVLMALSPFPDREDSVRKLRLRRVVGAVGLYSSEHAGSMPSSATQLEPYLGTDADFSLSEYAVSSLAEWPEAQEHELLLAYWARPSPEASPPPLFPFGVRGWPKEVLPERRFAALATGDPWAPRIETVPELEFDAFLEAQEGKINQLGLGKGRARR